MNIFQYDVGGISRQVEYLCLVGKYVSKHHANLCSATQRLSDTARRARNAKYFSIAATLGLFVRIQKTQMTAANWIDQISKRFTMNAILINDDAPHDGCNTSCQHASLPQA